MDEKQKKQARQWANVLTNPDAEGAYAPALSPSLAIKAKIARSFDVVYDAAKGGETMVIARPNVVGAYGESAAVSVPGPLEDPGSLMISSTYNFDFNSGEDNASGLVTVQENTSNPGSLFTTNKSLLGDRVGVPVEFDAGGSTPVSVCNKSGHTIEVFGWAERTTHAFVESPNAILADGATALLIIPTVDTISYTRVGIGRVGVADHADRITLAFRVNDARVSQAAGGLIDVVNSALLDQGKVSNIRCTALKMLITNLASPLNSGGEIVVARTNLGVIGIDVQATAENIKALPEKQFWRSGHIEEGAFVWYLPNTTKAYEPGAATKQIRENILIACLSMDPGGKARVNLTYDFEFYSPAPILSRKVGRSYTGADLEMLDYLWKQPACSGNSAHMALIAGIMDGAIAALEFYLAHRKTINRVAKAAVGIKSKPNKSKKKIGLRSKGGG